MTLADDTQQPVDCGKFSLCSLIIRPCACTANGCAFDTSGFVEEPSRAAPSLAEFDVHIQGGDGTGSVSIGGELHNVHVTRAE
jgi:hypothetical protein